MRVLAMLHLYAPQHCAGAETTTHTLLRALVERGHQVAVQLSQVHPMFHTGPYTYDGVSVWPYRSKDDPIRWINSPNPPHLIVAHLENTLRASILGDMHKIPTVVLMHNSYLKSIADLRWGARLVVYNTQWVRAEAERWWTANQGSAPPRGIVVHPPIFPEQYRVSPPSARSGCVTLVNLYAEKGSATFYALAERFPRQRFLGVCGAYGKQVVRRDLPNVEIIQHVAAHEMGSRVYARTRVLLAPSSYESYGRVAVEAACSGIPTIAHPTPGLVEALGEGGTFADRDDIDAWAAALRALLTAKGWSAASARARSVADGLDTVGDLQRWAAEAERLGRAARVPTPA